MKRKQIVRSLRAQGIFDSNNCKVLEFYRAAGKYYFCIRDRGWNHYIISIKGNHIKASHALGSDKPKLMLKLPTKEYMDFVKKFRELTPNLEWRE